LLLIGMMGAGKSAVGHQLADTLEWGYIDSDEDIFRRTGRTVPEIWHTDGEAAFRVEEAQVLADGVAASKPTVVSVAGGAVLAEANREIISSSGGLVVWLRARVGTLIERAGDGAGRPLLEGDVAGIMTRLERERRPVYETLAEVIVDVDDVAPEVIVERVLAALAEHRGGGSSSTATTPVGDTAT
jgi:shikimate kinase